MTAKVIRLVRNRSYPPDDLAGVHVQRIDGEWMLKQFRPDGAIVEMRGLTTEQLRDLAGTIALALDS